jgi:hypothetical protein
MEINDFYELHALYKLLGKVKFQEDLDFFEFKEFVGSPLIANIYKRVHDEFWEEARKRGDFPNVSLDSFSFKLESKVGRTIKRRIDEWTESDRRTLSTLKAEEIENLLWTLITPYNCEKIEYEKLKEYAFEVLNKKTCQ